MSGEKDLPKPKERLRELLENPEEYFKKARKEVGEKATGKLVKKPSE
ncbi:MAG: hypothetical protein ACREGJ_02115 [Candidatus Saccharimonadales bacterium]